MTRTSIWPPPFCCVIINMAAVTSCMKTIFPIKECLNDRNTVTQRRIERQTHDSLSSRPFIGVHPTDAPAIFVRGWFLCCIKSYNSCWYLTRIRRPREFLWERKKLGLSLVAKRPSIIFTWFVWLYGLRGFLNSVIWCVVFVTFCFVLF